MQKKFIMPLTPNEIYDKAFYRAEVYESRRRASGGQSYERGRAFSIEAACFVDYPGIDSSRPVINTLSRHCDGSIR
jgi:hypothetical protein